jgi:nitrous oxidase accessory protein NosD
MKKTILKLSLSLLLVATLTALMMPVAASADDVGDLQVYDERYVAFEALVPGGDPGMPTGDGSKEHPWDTITRAISELPYGDGTPDRINVGPSHPQWYGSAQPENICVDKPVTIESMEGADVTTIDVGIQGLPQVVEIISSNVVLDGFTLKGAPIGVYVGPPDGVDYLENVHILNCIIEVDQVSSGYGIMMLGVKYPVIDNNLIQVGVEGEGVDDESVDMAYGIVNIGCFTSHVLNNNLEIHGDFYAHGIYMQDCPKSTVELNVLKVLAENVIDTRAYGIYLYNSPLTTIEDNEVTAKSSGNYFTAAHGITVYWSDKADVTDNDVTVDAILLGGLGIGTMQAWGIEVYNSNDAVVQDNDVNVTSDGEVSDVTVTVTELLPEEEEALADLEELLLETVGDTGMMDGGFGSSTGIKVSSGESVNVGMNQVNSYLKLNGRSSEDMSTNVCGVTVGIHACGSPMLYVMENVVDSNADVSLFVVDNGTGQGIPDAFGMGCSTALGVAVLGGPAMVAGNDVEAQGDLVATVRSYVAGVASLEEESMLSTLDADLVGSLYQSVIEILESDVINAEVTGSLPTIESMSMGGGMATGIGIEVIHAYGSVISANNPVSGTGNVSLTVYAAEPAEDQQANAMGGGTGVGIGIACRKSGPVTVENNLGVSGTGMADVAVTAVHDPAQAGTLTAFANGGGSGIGIGILLEGMKMAQEEFEDPTGEHYWEPGPMVIGNEVMAMGKANPVTVTATDEFKNHEAHAMGHAMGLGQGIISMYNPATSIISNMVEAHGDAMVSTHAEADSEYDPYSNGGAAGTGTGIGIIYCPASEIIDNESVGKGTADADVEAKENWAKDANAFAGSMAVGEGIRVFHSDCSLVSGNSVATGLGHANTDVTATSEVPLGMATTMSLATGMGTGIAVLCSAKTDVIECNTAAGEGTASVVSSTSADFTYYDNMGVAQDTDILVAMLPMRPYSEEDEASEEWKKTFLGKVNYNSMVDTTPLGINDGPIMVMDAGLLKIGKPYLDARYNWWNDPTGPSGEGPGMGEPLIYDGCFVKFVPWLYVEHTEVLEEQLGKFGFYLKMCKGLNTLSTPIALEENVVPSRTWDDIATNSDLLGKVKYVDRWEPGVGWVSVAPTDTLDPLDAWYIYLFNDCETVILMVNVDDGHPYAMPMRDLLPGWNLIGPNPIFDEPGMLVDEALKSVEMTSGGLPGYAQVVSPVVRCQESWHFVPGMEPEFMYSGDGYWVWMKNGDTLVGFGFTPLPDKPKP